MSICDNCKNGCRASFVYVMDGRADGCVKVGYAASPASRVAGLRKQFKQPIHVHRKFELKCDVQAMQIEGRAHEYLDRYRVGGSEWFQVSPADAVSAIEAAIRWEAKQ